LDASTGRGEIRCIGPSMLLVVVRCLYGACISCMVVLRQGLLLGVGGRAQLLGSRLPSP